MTTMQEKSLSVIIPIYNEAANLANVIKLLKETLEKLNLSKWEIITINDGSTDDSEKILQNLEKVKIINHPYNKGYGSALKSGTLAAQYEWLIFFDSDGQHKAEYISEFLRYTDNYDLIAGDRTGGKYVRPTIRKPGLWLLRTIANYLVDYKIPDLNCGLRLVKKSMLLKYLHLMPHGFSFSTTSTMAFLKNKKSVKFVPISIERRGKGSKSTVKASDMIKTLMLICRLIMTFSPLRIFLPVSIILGLIGFFMIIWGLILNFNITKSTTMIVLAAIMIFFFGLLADQIAAIRREINDRC